MDRILEKLEDAENSINLVKENIPDSFEEFGDLHVLKRDGIYKRVQHSIQNILDIASMILKNEDLDVPSSDGDMIDNLKKSGVIDPKISEKIRSMKGFRNFLVHRYGKVDEREAFEDIKDNIDDFEYIFKEFRKYLK